MKSFCLAACLVALALPAYAQSFKDGDAENMLIGQAAQKYNTCLMTVIRERALETCELETAIAERAYAACKESESMLVTTIETFKDEATVERARQMLRISERYLVRLVKDTRKEARKSCLAKPVFQLHSLSSSAWHQR